MSLIDITAPAPADVEDDFDLDIRIAVAPDVKLPEAGFTCSWYTCLCCTGSSMDSAPFCCA